MFNFLSKKSIGLNIADDSITAVELKKTGGLIKLDKLNKVKLPAEIVKNGRIINEEELAAAVQKILARLPSSATPGCQLVFGFPENQTYLHLFSFPHEASAKINQNELEKKVLAEAWGKIPIVRNEMLVEYEIVENRRNGAEVLVVAAAKRAVLEWQNFFNKLGLTVATFDVTILANYRGLSNTAETVCLIDLGLAVINIYIFDQGRLRYEDALVLVDINLTAEKGTKAVVNDNFFYNPTKIFPEILARLKIALTFWQTNHQSSIAKLILIGDNSQRQELIDYFYDQLDFKTEAGVSKLLPEGDLSYLSAAGLALRNLNSYYEQNDSFVPFVEEVADSEAEPEVFFNQAMATDKNAVSLEDATKETDKQSKTTKSHGKKPALIILLVVLILIAGYFYFYKDNKPALMTGAIAKISNFFSSTPANTKTNALINEPTSTSEVANITQTATSSVSTTSAAIVSQQVKVLIKKTETGYLNIRSGAGASFPIVAKIKPDETYVVLERGDDWTKLKINDTLSGWAASRYLEEKK